MFNLKFATDFWTSKTTWHSFYVTAMTAYAITTHQVGLFPGLIAIAGIWHLTFLRDTLAKAAEWEGVPVQETPETPEAPEVPAAPVEKG